MNFWQLLASGFDALIAPAYGAPGFRVRQKSWHPGAIPERLEGKVYAVTGANAGIGRAIVEGLARRGAAVQMICRSRERGERARRELVEETGNGKVSLRLADMADLESVRQLGEAMAAEMEQLDGLVHNAGALFDERATTEQGLERTVALHVVGPHLLTELLVDPLAAARSGRVVWMSSGGMYTQRLDVDLLFDPPEPFDGVVQYARAKRAQVVLAHQWDRQLGDRGICVNAMHPGWVDTGGVRSSLPIFYKMTKWFLRTPEQGADTAVWLCASPEVERCGAFYFDRESRREHLPGASTRAPGSEREKLWHAVQKAR